MQCSYLFISLIFSDVFIAPDAHGTKSRRRKSAPENVVDLWRQFHERVSWASEPIMLWLIGQENRLTY